MNRRERFLTAMAGGVPDRVPATPDISNYIPAMRTGLPFWDIYFFEAYPLWKAYLDAADYFGIDSWINSCWFAPLVYAPRDELEEKVEIRWEKDRDAMIRRTVVRGPAGAISSERTCFRFDPPTPTEKPIKDLERDWPAYRALIKRMPVGLDAESIADARSECAKREVAFGIGVGYPGLHGWFGAVEHGMEQLSYAAYDRSPILDEWYDIDLARGDRHLDLAMAEKPDYILFGGSGTLTLSSPEFVRRYTIPALKRWTAKTKAAGIPTLLHSCGRSRDLVDMLGAETDLDCVNPLEIAPMGDVDLAEVKRAWGHKLAFMGNLHTTDIMLRADPDTVYKTARQAIRDAGQGGGFILSTGDQCPRDTPEENLFALVRAAQEHGVYDKSTGKLANP